MNIFLVGGAVRDKLLGLAIKDRDWLVVGSTPETMLENGFISVGKDFPVFLHPKTKEEYALARTERKSGRGYHGFKFEFPPSVTIEEDLLRRDLTINAMAEDENGLIIDPFGGQNDLKNCILRHVSQAFRDDPLRLLRIARFRSQLGYLNFSIHPETFKFLKEMVKDNELLDLSLDRIWLEFKKSLLSDYPHYFLETLYKCTALDDLFPQIASIFENESSSSNMITFLRRLSEQNKSPELKFSVIIYYCNKNKSKSSNNDHEDIISKYPIPNTYKKISSKVNVLLDDISMFKKLSLDKVLFILGKMELSRNVDVLESIITLNTIKSKLEQCEDKDVADFWRQSANAFINIDYNDLINKGIKGEMFAKQLIERRKKALHKIIAKYA